MKIKDNLYLIPLIGFLTSLAIAVGFLTIALYMGKSWLCDDMSLFGVRPTCVEAMSTSAYGLLLIGSMLVFGVWFLILAYKKRVKRKIKKI